MPRRALLLVFLCALGVRLAATETLGRGLWQMGVTARQLDLARNALEGRPLTVDAQAPGAYMASCRAAGRLVPYEPAPSGETFLEASQDPGYGFFVAFAWALSGSRDPLQAARLQSLVDALAAVLVALAAARAHSAKAGLLAGLGWGLFLPQVALVATPCYYGFPAFAAALSVFFLAHTPETEDGTSPSPQRTLAFLTGLGIGLVHLVRSVVVLLSLALVVGVYLKTRSLRRTGRAAFFLLLGHALVVTPLLVRNHALTGRWRPTRGVFWHMVWVGLGQHENRYGCENSDAAAADTIARKHGVGIEDPSYERHMRDEVLAIGRAEPSLFVRNWALRLARLSSLFPGPLGRTTPVDEPQPRISGYELRTLGSWGWGLLLLWPFALGRLGRRALPGLVPFLYFTLTVTPYYWDPPYLVPAFAPLVFALAIFFAEAPLGREAVRAHAATWAGWGLALLGPALLRDGRFLGLSGGGGLAAQGFLALGLGLLSREVRREALPWGLVIAWQIPPSAGLALASALATAGGLTLGRGLRRFL